MKRILIVLAMLMLVIETSLYTAYPIGLVPPVAYFSEEERPMFLFLVLLTFGTGYPLLAFIAGQKVWTKKALLLLLTVGIIVKIFLNSGSMLLGLAVALLISSTIKRQRTAVGFILLGIGLFFVAVPLLILYYGSETYMDVEAYQSTIALFQSKDYMAYILYNLKHFIGADVLITLFILLPAALIGPAVISFSYRSWKFVAATCFIMIGVMIKSLVIGTSSSIAFHIFTSAGGWVAALGLFILLYQTVNHVLSIGWAVFFAQCCLLLTYTNLGIGHYRSLTLEEMMIRSIVIFIISAALFFVVEKFSNRNNVKA